MRAGKVKIRIFFTNFPTLVFALRDPEVILVLTHTAVYKVCLAVIRAIAESHSIQRPSSTAAYSVLHLGLQSVRGVAQQCIQVLQLGHPIAGNHIPGHSAGD